MNRYHIMTDGIWSKNQAELSDQRSESTTVVVTLYEESIPLQYLVVWDK